VTHSTPGQHIGIHAGGGDELRKRWRGEFPYHWDADDLVSRRELLQFAVYASGALFASTAVLAVLGAVRGPRRSQTQQVARVSDVPEGAAVYFTYPEADDQAMLLHLPGGRFVAYSQRCTHLSCAVYYQPDLERLYCPCHEGVFSPQTGDPVAGPPQRRLERITLRQDGDMLYALDIRP
jgi:nitrite reductase/ring-hydroxylating ferredoxin subunit